MGINKKNKRKFGLIGKNIDYSFSKIFFKEKFKIEKINDSIYENFDIKKIDLVEKIFKIKNLIGLNVTIPYKETIIPYLDFIDNDAKKIGAVNTICFMNNGQTKGYNTDVHGFEFALFSKWKKNTSKCLILGTGGASKAIEFVLTKNNILSTFVSRKPNKNQIAYNQVTKEILKSHKLIINCTPVGTFPNINEAPEIGYKFLTKDHFLFDLIYNPMESKFLKNGLAESCSTMNGLNMLKEQANKAWELWNQ